MSLPACLYVCLSVCLSVSLSPCFAYIKLDSATTRVHASDLPSVCLASVCLSVCALYSFSVHLLQLSISSTVCCPIGGAMLPAVQNLLLNQPDACVSACRSVCISISLSVFVSVCLSVCQRVHVRAGALP